MLIAIEGVDGAGKRTLTDGLRTRLRSRRQKSVATAGLSPLQALDHADLAAEALHGSHGDLADSVYAMAVLFALDRAGARDEIARLRPANDVVILDRYVASNAAYSAARLHQGVDGEVVAWVRDLEFDRFGLPQPDWQVLLAVPAELAAERARAARRGGRRPARDAYERDDGLQQRTGGGLRRAGRRATGAAAGSSSGPDVDPAELAAHAGVAERRSRCGKQNARVVAGVYRDLVTPWTP